MAQWRDGIFFDLGGKLTEEQVTYLDSIMQYQLTVVNALAGTGKTTLAVGAAKIIGKPLVYLFAPVEEAVLGFRPGTTAEKEADYLQPLRDALVEIGQNPAQAIRVPDDLPGASHLNRGAWVSASSHTFLRGRNLQHCTVIIAEAQNWTVPQLRKALTRIHDNCTVIVEGHTGQCDLPDPTQSGFPRLLAHFADKPYANIVGLTKNFRGQLARDADEM